jgi:hypothetical protein
MIIRNTSKKYPAIIPSVGDDTVEDLRWHENWVSLAIGDDFTGRKNGI